MHPRLLSCLLLFVLGCHPPKETGSETGDVGDADNDGYLDAEDCDDRNPEVNPSATETCNGIDDDCDTLTDEDVAGTFYQDFDGDGFGNDAVVQLGCDLPQGYVPVGGDCLDEDDSVHPGATESCDGQDNDCDGTVDEEVTSPFWFDADRDGWGAGEPRYECAAPDGWTPNGDDCNDASALSYPGAPEECDGLDNDCDLEVDEGVTVSAWVDGDGDGFGQGEPLSSCAILPGYADTDGDCDDALAVVFPGAPETCDALDNDCDGAVDEDGATWFWPDGDGDGAGAGDPVEGCALTDGYSSTGDDCDDSEPAAFPGAPESCDGLDNDCDGLVDDGVLTGFWADADGDGHGAGDPADLCSAPEGWVPLGDDCDDASPTSWPGAEEVCDSLDNDCDGAVDEGTLSPTWADLDGDGYGAGESFEACAPGPGTAGNGDDCDDTTALANPAAAEVCDGLDNDCDGAVDGSDAVDGATWYLDADADGHGDPDTLQVTCTPDVGYIADGTDCDDAEAAVSPSATEQCDGLDNDCDGDVDEADALDASTWYADADGDGWGDPLTSTVACDAPPGWVANDHDCDDDEAADHPEATEVCNGRDDDCDGVVDEPEAADATSWYTDGDGDGWGVDTSLVVACDAPDGTVAAGGDCDDTDAVIHPAASETCNHVDDDCDGTADDGLGFGTWYGDEDGDGWGDGSTSVTDCAAPDGWTAESGDCDDADETIHPGAPESCDGLDQDCDGTADDGLDFLTWYADGDVDGWGDPGTATLACARPDGWTETGGDCDDANPGMNPEAAEVCDGLDNDCDGTAEDGLLFTTWYRDGDLDGHGDPLTEVDACAAPEGYVADGADCNDGQAGIHPGAREVCNGADDDCDGSTDEADADDASTWYQDGDGDGVGVATTALRACAAPSGYAALSGDCDDADDTIYPAAPEACDSKDNDCDGTVDDGVTTWTWYRDADSDGYGTSSTSTDSCARPSGYVDNAVDCDDADGSVFPGAPETCDDQDEDCDGTVDDGVGPTWYEDADGDGWGLATSSTVACTAPTGWVSDHTDCDDTTATTWPGAPETCNGTDDDCDGFADEGVRSTFYRDADGDGYGTSTSTTTGCSAPSGYVSLSTDCDDTAATTNPGASETCEDGKDNDCDGTVDDGCIVYTRHCGYISSDETWTADTVHYLTCDVYVQGGMAPTLTIEDGATVVAAPNVGLLVGYTSYGDLQVEGTSLGVTFTAYGEDPAPGDWDGLYIGYYDRGSVLEGLTLEYGGGNGYGGIQIAANGSPTLTDSLIRYNDNNGVFNAGTPRVSGTVIEDNDGNGWAGGTGGLNRLASGNSFTDNVITGNLGYAMALLADYAGEVDGSCSFTGNLADYVGLAADYVETTQTWNALDVPWRGLGVIYVQGSSSPRLTIADGAELEFVAGSQVNVAYSTYGSMTVEGDDLGVLFTSAEDVPLPGDWNGVTVGYYDRGSVFTGATIAYGGGTTSANLTLSSTGSPTVEGCTFTDSGHHGLYVSNGTPAISGSTFSDNTDNGIYLTSSADLSTTGTPSFDGNILLSNGAWAMTLPANSLGQVGSANLMGDNVQDAVQVLSDYVEADATWRAQDIPYQVDGTVYIQGSARPQVVIEDGATFLFDPDVSLYVGYTSYGALTVNGTASGVYMGSSQSLGLPGDWYGLYFGYYTVAAETAIDGLTLEHGGGNGYGGMASSTASFAVTDSTFSANDNAGLYVSGGALDVSGCLFEGNEDFGVEITGSGGLATTDGPTFHDNLLTDNDGYPISLPANYAGQLDSSSSFTGNLYDYVVVTADNVERDATWQRLDADWYVQGMVYIQGSARPTVTVNPGATFRFDYNVGLYVGYTSYGAMTVNGSSAAPVVFTSVDASPSNGDWYGLYFGYYCQATSTRVDWATVEYGGGNGYGNVAWFSCNGSMTDATVQHSSRYGIYRSSATPTLTRITYADNTSGDLR